MLNSCLSVSAETARLQLRAAYAAIPDSGSRPIVLFGAGPLGRRTAQRLAELGRPAAYFADNNASLWECSIDGNDVLSPAAALARHGEDGIFVVTIYNGEAARAQLLALGCRWVLAFSEFYYGLPSLLPWYALEDPSAILDEAHHLCAVADLWADEASRREFAAQIAWRLGDPVAALDPHGPPAACYFPRDLMALPDHGVVVDCGAYDGDSLRLLLAQGIDFAAFLAMEPDPKTYARLVEFVDRLEPEIQAKIVTRRAAAAATNGTLRFDASGSVASGLTATGDAEVTAIRLDDLLAGRHVALIKMDIEGGELEALEGAREVLVREKPILAISAYHRSSDLWTIPRLIKSIVPAYDLYLRRYAEDCWELVCYAIPPSRQ